MRKTRFYLMVAAISLGMLACNTGNKEETIDTSSGSTAFDMQKARSAIDSINAKFSDELKKGDSAALASHYSTDAMLMLSNSEPIKGKDILSAWGGMIRMGVKDLVLNTTDITGNADLLVETGTYEMKGENNTVIDKGKYVVAWKYENGEWKLYRDIANTNLPAAVSK